MLGGVEGQIDALQRVVAPGIQIGGDGHDAPRQVGNRDLAKKCLQDDAIAVQPVDILSASSGQAKRQDISCGVRGCQFIDLRDVVEAQYRRFLTVICAETVTQRKDDYGACQLWKTGLRSL
ncbi:MAG: hypothetical protein QNJ20_16550 [Paracoccaceae bacterium]|nr:hypothetical protein [Paracoccaceae bacterium]